MPLCTKFVESWESAAVVGLLNQMDVNRCRVSCVRNCMLTWISERLQPLHLHISYSKRRQPLRFSTPPSPRQVMSQSRPIVLACLSSSLASRSYPMTCIHVIHHCTNPLIKPSPPQPRPSSTLPLINQSILNPYPLNSPLHQHNIKKEKEKTTNNDKTLTNVNKR